MSDFSQVAVVNSRDYLHESMPRLFLTETTFGSNTIKELSTLTNLHHQVDVPKIFECFKKFYYVRMILAKSFN